MSASQTPLLREAISNGLVEHGFRRLPRGVHVRAVRPDWCVVVATGPRIRTADAGSVYVGLHHHGVERLLAELMGLSHGSEDGTTTINSYLGHFFSVDLPPTPGEKPGSITRATPAHVVDLVEREAERLAVISDLDQFIGAYPNPTQAHDEFRYTTIHLIRGDLASAAAHLVALERTQCDSDMHEAICNQYRRFRSNVIAFGGEAFERVLSVVEAASAGAPPPPRDSSNTLTRHLVNRIRAVVQANPDFANEPRDIHRR